MTPEERQLLTGLFERVREQAAASRDAEAEQLISDAVRAQPYAPYLLAQAVIVQDHALRAANQRLQDLEAQVKDLESAQNQSPASSGSFLGALGKSLFGDTSQRSPAQAPPSPWAASRQTQQPAAPAFGTAPGSAPPPAAQPFGPSTPYPQASPWGAPAAPSGGFLHGALGAAAGVAGGVLLANSIRNLFSGSANPYGMASGFGPGATIDNNNYGADQNSTPGLESADYDAGRQGSVQDDDPGDWSNGDDAGGGDVGDSGSDDYNV